MIQVDTKLQGPSIYKISYNVTVETYGVDYGMPETHEAFNYSQYLYKLMSQYYSNGNN